MPQDRPKRPYRSLRDFVARHFNYSIPESKRLDPGFWPCIPCDGRGRYRKEEDRDIIEGFKLAPWYTCEACKGTGRGPKEEVQAILRQIIYRFRAALAAWKVQDRLCKSGLRKLTKDERKALGV